MEDKLSQVNTIEPDEKSFFAVIVHSFFIIPFLIAVFCILLFVAVRILTLERHNAYDYLEEVKRGGLTQRWQAAFELSKILADPNSIPREPRFDAELMNVFEHSKYDNDLERQYLALAMGRTGEKKFLDPLLNALKTEKEENLYALIYAIGILKDARAVVPLQGFLNHSNARVRLVAVMALGNLGDPKVIPQLKGMLNDPEPNVQWDASIALAKLGDVSGEGIILKLLDRNYLNKFPEVDAQEQNHVLLTTIETSAHLKDAPIIAAIKRLAEGDPNMKVRRAALAVLK